MIEAAPPVSAPEPARSRRYAKLAGWVLLGLIGLAAAAGQLWTTRHGAGVSPDSTNYLSAAANFSSGRGLVHLGDSGELVPLELWPPGYPLLLSLGTTTVEEAWAWGRVLNALLFGANAVVVGVIIRRAVGGRWLPALIGAALFAAAADIVEIHSWIWSEPVTLLAGSLALLSVDYFLQSGRRGYLVFSAMLAAFALLTRYAAVAYIAAAAVALLATGVGRSSARLRALAIFLAISLLPTLLWMGRGGQVGGESLSRGLAMNERGLEQLGRGISIVADWLLPGRVVEPVRSDLTRGLLIGWLALIVWSLLARRSDRRRGVRASASYLPELLALFVVFYSGVLVAVRLFVVPGVSISPRIFSLGQAALISLTACALTEAYDRFGAWRAARALRRSVAARSALALGLLAAVAVPAAVNATHTLEFSRRVHAEGLGYAAPAWNAAPVIRYLADLPAATAIVSNGPDVIFFQTGRPARMLPQWPYDDPEGSVFRPDLAAEVSHRVEPGDVLVFFRGFAWRGGMSERQIKRAFSLSPLIGDDNGSAYRVEAVTLPAAFELEGEDGRGSEMFMAEVRRRAVVSPKEAERGA